MLNQKQKTQLLEREFYELDIGIRDNLSKEELFQSLDKKAGQQVDRNLLIQLYDRAEKNYGGKIQVANFIQIVLEAEQILRSKVENTKNYLEDFHRHRREAIAKLTQIQNTEQLNNYGIMPNSKLSIHFLKYNQPNFHNEASNLTQAAGIFQCGESQYETMAVECSREAQGDFIFNEQFQFSIETGMEDLNVQIYLNDRFSKQIVGQLMIPLNRLKDQNKHEEVLQLYGQDGQLLQDSIWIQLEWIYSKNKFLQDEVKRYDNLIQTNNDDLIDYEKDLTCLYLPFPNLLKAYKETLGQQYIATSQNNHIDQTNSQIYNPNTKGGFQKSPQGGRFSQHSQLQEYDKVEVKAVKMQSFLGTQEDSLYICRKLISILLAISSLILLYKAQYLDLLICFIFIIKYQNKQITSSFVIQSIQLVALSLLFELIWLWNFSSNWWDSYQGSIDPEVEKGMKQFTIVFVWIGFFIKIALLLTLKYLLNSITSETGRLEPFKDQGNNQLVTDNNQSYSNIGELGLPEIQQQQQQNQLDIETQQQQQFQNTNVINHQHTLQQPYIQQPVIQQQQQVVGLYTPGKILGTPTYNNSISPIYTTQQQQNVYNPQVSTYYPQQRALITTQNTPTPTKVAQTNFQYQ